MKKYNPFSSWTWLLALSGLILNIGLSKLVALCDIPLFLDSAGTIVVSALGGPIPGILVGFLTNIFTSSLVDPVSVYYAIINVLIAIIASSFSRHGLFKKLRYVVLSVFVFAFLGGVVGSFITWFLYGGGIGEGISAPLAHLINNNGFSPFWAQLTADFLLDIVDKAFVMAGVWLFLCNYPPRLCKPFPLGYVYAKSKPDNSTDSETQFTSYRRFSLKTRIITLIVATSAILGVCAVFLGVSRYNQSLKNHYAGITDGCATLASYAVDGDKIQSYISLGENNEDYIETEQSLAQIFSSYKDLTYLYVYIIHKDGIIVVFDLDTDSLEGEPPGTEIPFDESFPYLDELLKGEEIDPVITDDTYGWLLTSYIPIKNSAGATVAYACADIEMHEIVDTSTEFIIRIITVYFALAMIIIAFSVWYADRKLIQPIDTILKRTRDFSGTDIQKILEGTARLNEKRVTTGDELEELFNAVRESEDEIIGYIREDRKKANAMLVLQRNVIYAFADMVESRDKSTGDHIKRTSFFVKLVAEKLKEKGAYADTLTDSYLNDLVLSAPLHDIGKIVVSDTILNKPGPLTAEEFEIMKNHTVEGRSIIMKALAGVEASGFLDTAADMAAYHHERWDGHGYPEGLSGVSIPLCARIMAVADVYDALVSKRCYKQPFSFEAAIDVFKTDNASHFDPQIVSAFLDCIDVLREQYNEYNK